MAQKVETVEAVAAVEKAEAAAPGKHPYWLVEKEDGSANVGYLEEAWDHTPFEVIFRLDSASAARLRTQLSAEGDLGLSKRIAEVFGESLEKRSLEDALDDWNIPYHLDVKRW